VAEQQEPVEAFIAVGSNIEPEQHLLTALDRLKEKVPVTAVSTVYRTEPVGRPEQPGYLNSIWKILTSESPRALKFDVLRPLEAALGRVRSEDRYAPRTIDLDILLYGNAVIRERGLEIPDPDLRRRPFLAAGVLELAPGLVLPDTGEALLELVKVQAAELKPAVEFTKRLRDRLKP